MHPDRETGSDRSGKLTEYWISKLDTRAAVLDVIAVDQREVFYHTELRLASNDNHIQHVRFYLAMVDNEFLEKGTKYGDLPNTYIFYIISMNDFGCKKNRSQKLTVRLVEEKNISIGSISSTSALLWMTRL